MFFSFIGWLIDWLVGYILTLIRAEVKALTSILTIWFSASSFVVIFLSLERHAPHFKTSFNFAVIKCSFLSLLISFQIHYSRIWRLSKNNEVEQETRLRICFSHTDRKGGRFPLSATSSQTTLMSLKVITSLSSVIWSTKRGLQLAIYQIGEETRGQ